MKRARRWRPTAYLVLFAIMRLVLLLVSLADIIGRSRTPLAHLTIASAVRIAALTYRSIVGSYSPLR
jgi:hypothetical protein